MKQHFKRKSALVIFRKWDNKRYAVFNSLKKIVKIGTLGIAYLLFANTDNVSAQTKDSSSVTKNYDLESIDVTSDQLPETYSNISRVVVTVTKSEIEQAAVSSLNDLLELATNIDVRQRGINGMQADISIRGGSFDQILILLNGVNITDPQTGHHNLNLPIDISSVERIEILKGPGAWKFGPGAFSGAINIITSATQNSFTKGDIEFGQYAFNKEQITAGVNFKNTSHLISLNHSSTNGYVNNTDHRLKNIYYNGKILTDKSVLELQAGATDKAFGANSFYTAKYPDQYEEIQTYFASGTYKLQINNIQLEPKIYYRRNNDRFLLFRENPEWYSNFHTSDIYGANFLANIIHGAKSITTLGIDSRTEKIRSNNLGEEIEDVIYSPVTDTIILHLGHSRTNYSAFFGHKRYFKSLMVNAGVNLTYNSDIESKLFFYPGIDLNYSLNSKMSVFASVNKTMRMPTYTDLYYHGPGNEGNSNLLPEEALGYELGYKYRNKFVTYSLTGFVVKGENLIDWVRETIDDKWRTINYAQLTTSGIEFTFKTNLQDVFPNQNFLKIISFNYTYIDQFLMESNLISNYSLNYLKHRLDFNLNHTIWRNFQASWHIALQDRNGQFEKIIDKSSAGMVDYEKFITTDIKISWAKSGWNINGSINNIFDVDYFDIGNVVQPGRWIKIGIGKMIEFK